MIRVTPEGNIIWANGQYYKITGHPADDQYSRPFIEVVHPEVRAPAERFWMKLIEEHKPSDSEFRLTRKWKPPTAAGNSNPEDEPCWRPASRMSLRSNGPKGVHSKLAAEETKARKLQEAFIDLVSHEMRNPLSAIIQLADDITGSLEHWLAADRTIERAARLMHENVESGGRTILLCAAPSETNHRRRIDTVQA
ncbi:uncharacterized protein A1O9_07581 [Exophiala aquamarina CBS 119918]|uniref:PAS domain-containing protein n=1 Tax=Exophiala aquamarina CBS 119918 TaxID=1182545 RepID=A0A072P816_9EURO|nr:uncharacterized protein A1O9_07581 [Exophiala aquamarina CBS 119918]KEF56001.1 hypothetical protein A1O9_07581 [Exophiala aquamarina CBS 119918]